MYKCINLEIEIIRQKVCIDPHYQKKKIYSMECCTLSVAMVVFIKKQHW